MTDDNALDAAWVAYNRGPGKGRERMRAALAAADKVLAEGFDFETESIEYAAEWSETLSSQSPMSRDMEKSLRRAFAAGLAKGEAAGAALVEALQAARQYDNWAHDRGRITAKIDAALALVQKGV